jgi:hypothetical protein
MFIINHPTKLSFYQIFALSSIVFLVKEELEYDFQFTLMHYDRLTIIDIPWSG